MNDPKAEVHEFLTGLSRAILQGAPSSSAMATEIRRIVAAAKANEQQRHLRLPESAFLNRFVVPVLHKYLQEQTGLTAIQAREALLNEYHRSMPEVSSRSPIRATRHPFTKILGANPETIYRQWKDPKRNYGLTQSAPDFALQKPFPHSIVFEGKYFSSGKPDFAARQLVTDLYQAFFYRGLPKVNPTKRGHPAWDYDYACLLAFDASPNGTLATAWNTLETKVKNSFWEGANIYVMILRD
jgi:hypothetical protein